MSDKRAGFPFHIIGFDLDGTLLDTSGDLAAAVNHALALIARPPLSIEVIRPMIGGGARLMLRRGLDASGGGDEDFLDRLFIALIEYYRAHIDEQTRPFPGLLTALDQLADMGVRLGVVTNKREGLAVQLLDQLGMLERFDCVIGGDTMGPGKAKPHPAPIHEMIARCSVNLGEGRAAAFIGDSHFDIQAAKAAGIPAIACSFGFLNGPVADLGADAVIDHFDELIPILRTL
jgi:phosphoglycolate phosphatase